MEHMAMEPMTLPFIIPSLHPRCQRVPLVNFSILTPSPAVPGPNQGDPESGCGLVMN